MKHVSIPAPENKEASRPRSLKEHVNYFFSAGAKDWGISEGKLKLIFSVPFLIALSGVVTALFGKEAYKMLTSEDQIAESLQVLCYALSLVLTVLIIKNYRNDVDKTITLLYILLGFGLFFMIGEELSWGQRLIGWKTPESYAQMNKQEETNFHNIYGVGFTFKWLHMIVGAYGAFLPLVLWRSKKLERFQQQLSMLIPHYTLIPFFFLPFIWRFYRNFFEAPKEFYFAISEYSEVMELVLASGFVFFLLFQNIRLNRRRRDLNNGRL